MRIDPTTKTASLKIVYFGPGMSGKTTNLSQLHRVYPEQARGPILKLDTAQERTLFFDYFPANLGRLAGFDIRVHFFTVPGQSFYTATRRAVLDGADGVVFVADSQRSREEANLVSLDDLHRILTNKGHDPETFPLVFQWNKRDCKDVLPVDSLERQLNDNRRPSFEAIATECMGVWDTQTAAIRQVLQRLRTHTTLEPSGMYTGIS